LKIDPLYNGPVIHVPDASLAVPAANQLLNPKAKAEYVRGIKNTYQSLRDKAQSVELVSLEYARTHPFQMDWSKYTPDIPSFTGARVFEAPVKEIIPYINWLAFVAAWKFPVKYGKYMKLKTEEEKQAWSDTFPEAEKQKAAEAVRLLNDAQAVLKEWANHDPGFIKAILGFFPVKREEESIRVEGKTIPFLRQQEKREDDTYKSLADFFHPEGDFVGMFVITAGADDEKNQCDCGCNHSHETDAYTDMVKKLLRDRLAEASAEYFHQKVRKELWGYAPDESYSVEELMKEPYAGIRPASGYPVLPDISLNFLLDELLDAKQIGVSLTPNGAIYPNASVAGLYISNPESGYFLVGKIDDEQLTDYANRKGITVTEAKKWLGASC
jgi:5-methyltetrahydrofolate--homocysteine methyltransferase